MSLLDERRALVTGGANGIGRAIVERFVAEGAAVATVDVEDVDDLGPNVLPFRRDLSETDGLDALVDEVEKALGPLDVLVNNAGIFEPALAVELGIGAYRRVLAVNLDAPIFLAARAARGMTERGYGRIVNIADIAATIPWPAYLPYSMSKAAIVALTRGLAKALAPHVLVNAVAPGPVLLPDGYDETLAKQAIEPTLLKRTGTPEDVAETVVFLLSSDYITGQTVAVDGGRLLR